MQIHYIHGVHCALYLVATPDAKRPLVLPEPRISLISNFISTLPAHLRGTAVFLLAPRACFVSHNAANMCDSILGTDPTRHHNLRPISSPFSASPGAHLCAEVHPREGMDAAGRGSKESWRSREVVIARDHRIHARLALFP